MLSPEIATAYGLAMTQLSAQYRFVIARSEATWQSPAKRSAQQVVRAEIPTTGVRTGLGMTSAYCGLAMTPLQ